MRPIGIDLFAGAGGMSLGFEQAGFDVVTAVEVDPIHSAIHAFNFPKTTVIARSVIDLSAAEIRLASGIGSRRVDCVFGGPPCQGFSLIGHRALDDARNRLVLEFVRLVAELDAQTFVFENVKGLTVGSQKGFLAELVSEFEARGYCVRLPWKVLNAAHFGVPQNRERLILMGAKNGRPLPEYPTGSVESVGRDVGLFDLPRGPTCHDALADLPDADAFPELESSDSAWALARQQPSDYAANLRCLTSDAWGFGYIREWDPCVLTSSARTSHSAISKRRFRETPQGSVEPISRFYKLPASGLANTLRAGTDGARGAFTSPRPIHYEYARCVTVREMARLHGFPDWFRLHATKWHGARQIGNAVPPPLARALGTAVLNGLGQTASRPKQMIRLGGPELLYMDMSGACDYFNLPRIIGRRDRKSGARKRKQIDIEAERHAIEAVHG